MGWRVAMLAGVLGVLAGCGPGAEIAAGGRRVAAPVGALSVHQLAGRLGLRVLESSATCATLGRRGTSVMVFADPNGRAYVNGRQVGPTGGVTPVSGLLFVRESFEAPLARALPPAAPDRPARAPTPRRPRAAGWRGRPVVLDAGHGGRDPGAIGVNGLREKTVNLAVCERVARRLRAAGHAVLRTRRGDAFVDLDARAAVANRARARLFVSIHANAAASEAARGFEVYVCRAAGRRARAAAGAIARRLAAAGIPSRGVKEADFRVLVGTTGPAVLVEMGFLTNRAEAARLRRPDHQGRLAAAIAAGIEDFLAAG